MPTRLTSVVVDSPDPRSLARWWADALGWSVEDEDERESSIEPPSGEPGLPMVFVPVADLTPGKNRVHLDLPSTDEADQRAREERLLAAGASDLDIGQAQVRWTVMADPAGNAFCVLDPRPDWHATGAVAAIVVDAVDPAALARFWTVAAGWPVLHEADGYAALRAPDGRGPLLEFVRTGEPHQVKNRVHLDVAPFPDDDHDAEVQRLVGLGAAPVEVGQSDAPPEEITWVVLADPEGNEFCVLSCR